MITQMSIAAKVPTEGAVLSQFAALCYRISKKGNPKILLVTSRGTGRWVLPKGWPINGCTPAGSAAQEAWEEAGVRGTAANECLGLYSYQKWRSRRVSQPIMVAVYPMKVTELAVEFPEQGQRVRKWFSPVRAAGKVQEPELARILSGFHPDVLRGSTHCP
ncbi:NUDIX hydrolase [Parasedimentitalea maritima]|uniref:NUDIX domain-containing protein n=1 Tax=Parasedimentitalea maritima TaxID=2578117 RepID=A0A6A4RH33_9RHOB|nr:NUDIX hydrolase [Zongyanglinia marina]KAE9630179.1 NUDIX domain-containing protein [Zongyanglinia marina]